MSCCYALTKNFKRCRNYASIPHYSEDEEEQPSYTCQKHKLYFKKPLTLRSIHWENQVYLRSAFSLGLIKVSKEFVSSIPIIPHSYCYFLMLCARYIPEWEPSWNLNLWTASVPYILKHINSIGPFHISNLLVKSFINVKGGISYFYNAIQMYPNNTTIGTNLNILMQVTAADPLFSCVSEEIHKKYIALTVQELKRKNHAETARFLEEDFLETISANRKIFYWRCKNKTQIIKEDLIAMTWHPDRFMKWCLDEEEKCEMNSSWRTEF